MFIIGINIAKANVARMKQASPALVSSARCENNKYKLIMRSLSSETNISESLSELPDALQDIFANAYECVARVDKQGCYLSVNAIYAEVCGYSQDEMTGMPWQQTVHPDDLELMQEKYQQVLDNGRSEAQIKGVRKNGSVFYKQILMVRGLDSDTSSVHHYCFINDITEKLLDELIVLKSVKSGLEVQEQRFHELIKELPGAVFQCNVNDYWSFTYLSPNIEKMLGIPSHQFLVDGAMRYGSLIHEEDRNRVKQVIDTAISRGNKYSVEYQIVRKDGEVRWFRERAGSDIDINGNSICIGGTICDITEDRNRDTQFHIASALIDHSDDLILFLDTQHRYRAVSDRYLNSLGKKRDEVIGKYPAELIEEDRFYDLIEPFLDNEYNRESVEYCAWLSKNVNDFYHIKINPVTESRGLVGVVIVLKDLSQFVKDSKRLKEGEFDYQSVIENSADIMIISCLDDGRIMAVNRAFSGLMGYEAQEITGRVVGDLFVSPEHRKVLLEKFQQDGYCREFETQLMTKNGNRVPVALSSNIFKFEGENCVFSVVRDISERISAQEELNHKNRSLQLLQNVTVAANEAESIDKVLQTAIDEICRFSNWPIGHVCLLNTKTGLLESTRIWFIDESTPAKFTAFRKYSEQTLLKQEAGLPGRILATKHSTWIEDISKDSELLVADMAARHGLKSAFGFPVLVGDRVVAVLEFYSKHLCCKDNDLLDMLSPICIQIGRVIERKQSANALEQSQVNFTKAVNASPDSVIIIRLDDGKILDVNNAVLETTGYTREEVVNKGTGTMFWVDEHEALEHAKAIKRKGQVANYSMLTRRKDGTTIPCLMSSTLIKVDGYKCAFTIVKDISDLTIAYEELRAKEKHTKVISESSAVCISYVDTELRYIFNNMEFHKELGLNSESVLGKTLPEVAGEKRYAQLKPYLDKALSGIDVKFELDYVNPDGKELMYELTCHPDRKDGLVTGIYIASSNITDRKNTEKALVKTNRALRVLSECSRMLAEERDEKSLLQAACNIITEEGEYQAAWVGFIEINKERKLEFAAMAANSSSQLDNKFISEKSRIVQYLVDGVISSGKAIVVSNSSEISDDFQWDSELLNKTRFSVLGIPLLSKGSIIGIMAISSSQTENFDEEEINLLVSMAENLTYGLDSIRETAKRKKAESLLALENRTFKKIAESTELPVILDDTLRNIKSVLSNKRCVILLLDRSHRNFYDTVAVGVDRKFVDALITQQEQALCRQAVFLNQQITVVDTFNDELWHEYCQLERDYNYRSCCITPIKAVDGRILGVFSMYSTELSAIDRFELQIVDRMAYIIGSAIDSYHVQHTIKENEERLALAMRGSRDGLWDINLETEEIYWSPQWKSMLGYADTELEPSLSGFRDLLHPEDKGVYEKIICEARDNLEIEFRMRHKDGHYVDILSRSTGLRAMDGEKIIRIVGTHVDLSERNQVALRIRESESKFRTLYDDSPSMFLTLTQKGIILSINKYGADHLGVSVSALVSKSILDITHPDDAAVLTQKLQACTREPFGIQRCEIRKIHKYGDAIWVRATMRATGADKSQPNILVTCEDISEARILSEQLEYQANHDALTGLINRVEFEKRLRRVLNSDQDETDHALCYLDLDQFKIINDTCGHLAGDELLRRVGDILNTVVRKRDTLARMGGDEFAVLLEHCPLDQAKRVANELLHSIASLRFVWEGKRFVLGVSIGLVPMRAGSGTLTDILSAADEACYAAKDSGRNRFHVYYSDDIELSRRRGEMEWVSKINLALEEDQFCLHVQPISRLKPAREQLRGNHYEILLRMQGDDGQLIYPGAFLPAAERYNLADKIDKWVVRKTLDWLTVQKNELEMLAVCSINLSGHSMGDEGFLSFLMDQFSQTQVPPEKICFEITETAAIANLGAAIQFINALKAIGCLFALDDFGTGVSSFNYLKNLPVDFLKIDGSFIREIYKDPIDFAMVRSINEIGQVMGKETIAEFVESEDILEIVLNMGINYAQGYTIGKPVSIEHLL